jgi:class 3 adenylate cyclase
LGAHIPGAKVVELLGNEYFPHLGDQDAILDEIEEFLTGARPVHAPDRARGDDAWTRVLDRHDAAHGVRCAQAICETVRPLGIEARAGLHTGEIELRGDDVGGIAVHIGQRVSGLAGPGEVLVSSTVKDLVAGSGITSQTVDLTCCGAFRTNGDYSSRDDEVDAEGDDQHS